MASNSRRAAGSPARQYLQVAAARLRAIRREIPRLTELGEAMARPLLNGGQLFVPAVAKYWPSEFGNRAGGMMRLRLWEQGGSKRDAAFFALPGKGQVQPEAKVLQELVEGPMPLYAIGRPEEAEALGAGLARRIAGYTGGPAARDDVGVCHGRPRPCREPVATATAEDGRSTRAPAAPLVSIRPLEQIIRGWATGGELVAACTRGGKMPVLWMSVWLEGALVRNAHFVRHDNQREPWYPPLFHDDVYVPPLAPGRVTGEFLDVVEALHATLAAQTDQLAVAGKWMAEARRAGKRIFAVLVGHSYPQILDLPLYPEQSDYPVQWGRSLSDLRTALPDDFGAGDVAIHLGYAPTQPGDVAKWVKKGVRLIHSSPYGRTAGIKDHKNFLWLDLPWRPADACVDVPGYSVRLIPSSSSAETMAYYAMLAEMAGRMS